MHLKGIVILPPPPVSIADKDNDCEVSEPSNVRQSLSSGSLLQCTWKEDKIHNNAAAAADAAAASPIMMILQISCHLFKGEAYSLGCKHVSHVSLCMDVFPGIVINIEQYSMVVQN